MDGFSDGRYDAYMDSLVNRCYYKLKSLAYSDKKKYRVNGTRTRQPKYIVRTVTCQDVKESIMDILPKSCVNCANCEKRFGMNICKVYQALDEYCVIASNKLEEMASDCIYYEDKEEIT